MKKDLTRQNQSLRSENKFLKKTMGKMIATWNRITEGEITARCPFCREPYIIYPKIVGDQNACFRCKTKARQV